MNIRHLQAEGLRRIEAEAARRGVSIDDIIAELAARLPEEAPAGGHRLSFIGIGASDDTQPFDIHRERAELAAKEGRARNLS